MAPVVLPVQVRERGISLRGFDPTRADAEPKTLTDRHGLLKAEGLALDAACPYCACRHRVIPAKQVTECDGATPLVDEPGVSCITQREDSTPARQAHVVANVPRIQRVDVARFGHGV